MDSESDGTGAVDVDSEGEDCVGGGGPVSIKKI